jgi:pyruvate/2-oxoglutarate dehydrogenase complex dihydrolipoamide acyltransferase (E2) component
MTGGSRLAITIPEGVSLTSEEISVSAWLKQPGDPVKRGEVIAEIFTDKATLELEATETGTMGEILVPAGVNITVNQTIAWLELEQ